MAFNPFVCDLGKRLGNPPGVLCGLLFPRRVPTTGHNGLDAQSPAPGRVKTVAGVVAECDSTLRAITKAAVAICPRLDPRSRDAKLQATHISVSQFESVGAAAALDKLDCINKPGIESLESHFGTWGIRGTTGVPNKCGF